MAKKKCGVFAKSFSPIMLIQKDGLCSQMEIGNSVHDVFICIFVVYMPTYGKNKTKTGSTTAHIQSTLKQEGCTLKIAFMHKRKKDQIVLCCG